MSLSNPRRRLLEEVGLEEFGVAQTPGSVSVADTNTLIIAANPDRAYVVLTLDTPTATGVLYFSVRVGAVASTGQRLEPAVPVKIFNPAAIFGIASVATESGTVIFQEFFRGLPEQGTAG